MGQFSWAKVEVSGRSGMGIALPRYNNCLAIFQLENKVRHRMLEKLGI